MCPRWTSPIFDNSFKALQFFVRVALTIFRRRDRSVLVLLEVTRSRVEGCLRQLLAVSGSMIWEISVMVETGMPLNSLWRRMSASLSAR
jgi:hypothetical protein